MNNTAVTVSEETIQGLTYLKNCRIIFGHHSVGENILVGFKKIAEQAGEDITITKINHPVSREFFEKAQLLEFNPGKNTKPKTKIDDFVELIGKLDDAYLPDIALLKFCYVDIEPSTDVADLLSYYKSRIGALKKDKPGILIAHVTVPLTTDPSDLKSRIKKILGLQVWGIASNIARMTYNEMLRETFPSDPIFDLAAAESTLPDGTRVIGTYRGKTYYSLSAVYTNDGGHLNSLGQKKLASDFVRFLATTL